ncbi:MAG: tetratricopeptide repeat protein [Leptospiraceae bacterium]|nr:tetratricopeptide repeat protein [Leptospiraceae bacterium]MDW7975674.1 tetratricopeptide repeat protein [Leptospiraceae bacterium]
MEKFTKATTSQKPITKKSLFTSDEEEIINRILFLKQNIKELPSPTDYHELGILYFKIKNYDKCIEILDELQKKFPDYIDISRAKKLRILALIYKEQYQTAIKEIQERLQIEPQDVVLLSCLAYCYEKLNDCKKALSIHKKILQIEPEREASLNAYGYLLAVCGKNEEDYKLAEKFVQRALKKKPKNPYYLDSYAVVMLKLGKIQEAKEYIYQAYQLEPNNSEIQKHLQEIMMFVK